MKKFTTLFVEIKKNTAVIWLNRPEIHNAFNEVMITELIDCFEEINKLDKIRVVILKGKGKSFCSGADLNWMKEVANYTYEQNYKESYQLSKCFYTIYTCKKPTIAWVHGAVIGGANGLLAACDMAYCNHDTIFSLSEVKIGVIPACISPYVIKRVGEFTARELMLTGKRIKGKEAESIHLVNKSLNVNDQESYIKSIIEKLQTGGPKAIEHCKELIYNISNKLTLNQALEETARIIAEIRKSKEGQEGMHAFLEKRIPKWVNRKNISQRRRDAKAQKREK